MLEVGGIGLFYLLRNLGVGAQEIFYLVVLVAVLTMTLFVIRIRPHIHKPAWN